MKNHTITVQGSAGFGAADMSFEELPNGNIEVKRKQGHVGDMAQFTIAQGDRQALSDFLKTE